MELSFHLYKNININKHQLMWIFKWYIGGFLFFVHWNPHINTLFISYPINFTSNHNKVQVQLFNNIKHGIIYLLMKYVLIIENSTNNMKF